MTDYTYLWGSPTSTKGAGVIFAVSNEMIRGTLSQRNSMMASASDLGCRPSSGQKLPVGFPAWFRPARTVLDASL